MTKEVRRRKAKPPKILAQPIITSSVEGWVGDAEIAQVGKKLAAVCDYFGVAVEDVDLSGSTGKLVLGMAQYCFPEAFRIVARGDVEALAARKHHWTAPRKWALIALVDEFREQGLSVECAVLEVLRKYPSAKKNQHHWLKGGERSLVTRYYEFKRWASQSPSGEPGLPLNPDGTINFRAAADKLLSL